MQALQNIQEIIAAVKQEALVAAEDAKEIAPEVPEVIEDLRAILVATGTIITYNGAKLIALAPEGLAVLGAFAFGFAVGSVAVHLYPPLGSFGADFLCFVTGACDVDGSSSTEQVAPGDPNDILGPSGFGTAHFVTPDQPLGYQINFENKPDADVPAQVVVVTEKLDPDLDPRTFELGSFGFGEVVIDVPTGHNFFSTRIALPASAAIGGKPLLVDVTAGIDVQTGVATWTFTSLDPTTLDIPADVEAGFLPQDRAATGRRRIRQLHRPPAPAWPPAPGSTPRPASSSTPTRRSPRTRSPTRSPCPTPA